METPCVNNQKIAALKIDDRVIKTGTFPLMNFEKTVLLKQGVNKTRIKVGYAPFARGTFRCGKCMDIVNSPYVQTFQNHDFYTCAICKHINYVN